MGMYVVITGPSGSGKTTVCSEILRQRPSYGTTVSMTTRPARRHEQEGVHYYFVAGERFDQAIQAGELLEWEEVHDYRYGTLKQELERAGTVQDVVLLDVDPKGGLSVRTVFPNVLLIFLTLPSMAIQQERLEGRQTEDDKAIALRMQRTAEEMEIARQYDHVIINNNLEYTVASVLHAIDSWREKSANA